ncbi:MAG TPA: hypothetical protein VFZ64_15840 [Nocardioidaceae bacterium]
MSPRSRYLAAGLLLLASLAGPSAVVPLVSHGSTDVDAEVVTSFRDDRIDESSGLVVRGRQLFTVNDSGDGPYVYEVDLDSGETVGVTTYADEDPDDVEALASAPDGALWVGDIGDNRRSRGSIRVHRLRPAPGGGTVGAQSYELVYPGPPTDAEALLVHPRTGRLLVVTKTVLRGGEVFRAPRRLVAGQRHELERVAAVPGIVTGGTFLPGGDRVLLRSYGEVAVYTYPGFDRVASAPVPAQGQGEAVAVGDDGRVYLTSEGELSDVLVMDLPRPGSEGAGPETDATPAPGEPGPDGAEPSPRYDPEPWMGLGPWGLLLAVLGSVLGAGLVWYLLRAARRRGRRRP